MNRVLTDQDAHTTWWERPTYQDTTTHHFVVEGITPGVPSTARSQKKTQLVTYSSLFSYVHMGLSLLRCRRKALRTLPTC